MVKNIAHSFKLKSIFKILNVLYSLSIKNWPLELEVK